MSQKHRPSLSQTAALYGQPGTITDQIAEARAKARSEIANGFAASAQQAEAVATLRQLAAPPSAVKARHNHTHQQRKKEAFMREQRRQSKPPQRIEPTSAAPTPERASKEPLPMELELHAGGQVSHKRRTWVAEYGEHLKEQADAETVQYLLKVWSITNRVRMTSDRAYTGAPYAGGGGDREGHIALKEGERRDLELFAYAVEHLTAQDKDWWEWTKVYLLHEAGHLADGRIPTMAEFGAQLTAYKPKSENARTSGVVGVRMLVKRVKESLRFGAMRQQYERMRRQAMHEEAVTLHVDERRVRLAGQRKEIEDKRKR